MCMGTCVRPQMHTTAGAKPFGPTASWAVREGRMLCPRVSWSRPLGKVPGACYVQGLLVGEGRGGKTGFRPEGRPGCSGRGSLVT